MKDLASSIRELRALQKSHFRAMHRILDDIVDGQGSPGFTEEEKDEESRYHALSSAVERFIFETPFIVSDDPIVRDYIKDSVAYSLKQLQEGEYNSQLEGDVLFSWFSPSDYCKRYVALGHIYTKYPIPDDVRSLVEEARRCFAMGQYVAAVAVSRAMFEKTFTDLAVKLKRIPPITKADYFNDYPPRRRLEKLVGRDGRFYRAMSDFYSRASEVIHGSVAPDEAEALILLEQALGFVSGLINSKTQNIASS